MSETNVLPLNAAERARTITLPNLFRFVILKDLYERTSKNHEDARARRDLFRTLDGDKFDWIAGAVVPPAEWKKKKEFALAAIQLESLLAVLRDLYDRREEVKASAALWEWDCVDLINDLEAMTKKDG